MESVWEKGLEHAVLTLAKNVQYSSDPVSEIYNIFVKEPSLVAPLVQRITKDSGFNELYELRYNPALPKIEDLVRLPDSTLGKEVGSHMARNNLKFDFLANLPKLESPAQYFFYRMTRIHDISHTITGYDTSPGGELALQAFNLGQSHSVGAILLIASGLLKVATQNPNGVVPSMDIISQSYQRGRKTAKLLVGIRWEDLWNQPLNQARSLLGLEPK
jgi:ubiquinone biosynthesis protein COQ4